ncbi:MAG: hypothetical protein COC19_05250 [SAR86 cluster bacterium]|uniref:Peptidase M20 dimerisation domain-containing protein n=1 Tax=SAR86 cluster bacterium TaxID=2030880 RepID=A0A2A4MM80_9GAMM|nr:MAG: hypothetical protein COC19_05250 [SAR86 cluster bacterium]
MSQIHRTEHAIVKLFSKLVASSVLASVFIGTSVQAAANLEQSLTSQELQITQYLDGQQDNMLALLERITNINSGSLNKAGVASISEIFANEFRTMGFNIGSLPGEVIDMPSCPGSDYTIDVGDHLLASRHTGQGKKLLLMGHMDTVFPLNSPFQTFQAEGDRLSGPGVSDMKGGLVIMLYALKALHEFDLLDSKHISILLNSDEEVGSLSSRKYLEQQALLHDYGLVFEPSGNDTMVRRRKGLGQARFVVSGRASHAGAAHEQGRSAIKELAYKIVAIEQMTDYETGVTVNVGVISGGEARNTVSPCAEALVDLRYPTAEQGIAAQQQFNEIFNEVYSYAVDTPDITTEVWINLHRPPKIPTTASDHLLDRTIKIGKLLGQDLRIADSGGGTDGSLTQAVGLPTLDSLGIAGTGAHSKREVAMASSLAQRAKLSAILIGRLSQED